MCRGTRERVVEERRVVARGAKPQPVVVNGNLVDLRAVLAEGMKIRMVDATPILKLNTEFEGRLGVSHEFVFVYAEQRIERSNGWNGCLANADGGDVGGFDQRYFAVIILEHVRERGGSHPAGSAAADNGNVPYAIVAHRGLPAAGQVLLVSRCGLDRPADGAAHAPH